jgi:hypothetical protein
LAGVIVFVWRFAAKLGLDAMAPQTTLPFASSTANSAAARFASRVPYTLLSITDLP